MTVSITTATRTVANLNDSSSLMGNSSTPSRRQQLLINLQSMVNKIMESIYTWIYMIEHLLSGLPPRGKKLANTPPAPVKPALPKENIVALTRKLKRLTCNNLKF
jgi:hypothetical protein